MKMEEFHSFLPSSICETISTILNLEIYFQNEREREIITICIATSTLNLISCEKYLSQSCHNFDIE